MMKNYKKNTGVKPAGADAIPWIAGVLFILGLAILAGIYRERIVVVDEVRFGGHYFVPLEELRGKTDIHEGISPDSLDFMKLIKDLETLTYVKTATVGVEPGGSLYIGITERRPVALMADASKKIYVDEEGVRLPIIPGKAVDVPLLYGFKTGPLTDTLKSESWQQTSDFLKKMQGNQVCNATISEIVWSAKEGIIALSHENGVKLFFGKGRFEKRLRNWEAFYSDVVREKGIRNMQLVDLRFKGQVVTRES